MVKYFYNLWWLLVLSVNTFFVLLLAILAALLFGPYGSRNVLSRIGIVVKDREDGKPGLELEAKSE